VSAIVLIGPMGSGKTTYGKKLARNLALSFTDTDRVISAQHGDISEIFAKHGEPFFRALETEALSDALESGGVVATGGGVVIKPENRELLAGHRVLYLETSAQYTANRLDTKRRPLLAGGENRWQQIFAERQPLYEQLADATVFTGGKSIARVMEEIETAVRGWH
jgi:shikimate kinase